MPDSLDSTAIDFNVRHQTYLRYFKAWETAYDFKRDGIHVLDPDHDVEVVKWQELVALTSSDSATLSGSGAEPESPSPSSRFDTKSGPNRSYLFKHDRETKEQFNNRCRRAYNYPLFQYIINVCTAGVLRHEPQREGATGVWSDIYADFDLAGTTINAHERMTMALALTFGRMHTLVDRPKPEKETSTRRDQREMGIRAYGYSVTPIDLVDWSKNREGVFNWATIMEPMPDTRKPGTKTVGAGVQYRVWYPDHWELWVPVEHGKENPQGKDKFRKKEDGEHPCGRVPIATLWAGKLNEKVSMAIESPLASHLYMNRSIFNDASEANESERTQTFSLLAIPVGDGETIGAMDISHWSAMSFNSNAGVPVYVSPDSALPQGKMARIKDKIEISRDLAATSRGKAEQSKEERAASAIALESENKRNQLTMWAQALVEYNKELHEIIAAWEEADKIPTAVYNMDFDSKAVSTAISDAVQLASIPVIRDSPDVQAAIAKPIVRRIMTDAGDDDETIDETLGMLDAADVPTPAPLNMETDGPL
jgi:hypothetical protein